MKVLTILWLANVALANSYYVLRRGVPARGLAPSGGIPLRPGVNAKAVPPRRVATKAESSPSEDVPYSSQKTRRPGASVSSKGPASIFHVDREGNSVVHNVPEGKSAFRRSSHPTRPLVGGSPEGKSSKDEPTKVSAEGKFATVSINTPPGGSGQYKVTGEGGMRQHRLGEDESVRVAAHNPKGGAKAEGSVSRGGKAFGLGFNSPIALDPNAEYDKMPEKDNP
ncbi:MAG: hypothetical protein GOMPHAMPRED_001554 [Gomphillus americanus]|uniref:Uncharacterized protein n=1 Tax=Gomphillus americanus TaxID=1940652 RepID=A0A8H3F9G8_9LECA|nr:MAG: hypothetical protein GOMPHAMPRED_001554 [Gomphillus americanus]